MTSIPSTARNLSELSTVALTDAAILLARVGSTDGKATLAALATQILGPQLVASIGGVGAAETYSLTTGAWVVVDFPTADTLLQLATSDDAGTITASLAGAGPLYADVSWSIGVVGSGSHSIDVTTYIEGAAAGSVHRARVTTAGKSISGGAIVPIADGDTIQVALRSVSGSISVDVESLAIRVRYVPRVTTP